jgi:hypothetical protein
MINVRSFGAKGDGITDDWAAINAANNAAAGGRLFFPPGHYRATQKYQYIACKNNTTYEGVGDQSFLDFEWNVFQGSGSFYRGIIAGITTYPAHDIVAGDQVVTLARATDSLNFAVGDIIMARSTTAYADTPADTEPYYIEINRVTAIDSIKGALYLEDPAQDGWAGILVGVITANCVQNVTIKNLRARGNYLNGSSGVRIDGAYKSLIENCALEGGSFLSQNAFVRSTIRNCTGTVSYSAAYGARALELAIGSVGWQAHDCTISYVNKDGSVPTGQQIFYLQEFSRRARVRNINIIAPQFPIENVMFFPTAGGHEISDCRFDIASGGASGLVRYSNSPAGLGDLRYVPFVARNNCIECRGAYDNGVVLASGIGDPVENVTIDGLTITGTANQSGLLFSGDVANITINKLITNGAKVLWPGITASNVNITNSPGLS